jgi:hypothetical protein
MAGLPDGQGDSETRHSRAPDRTIAEYVAAFLFGLGALVLLFLLTKGH